MSTISLAPRRVHEGNEAMNGGRPFMNMDSHPAAFACSNKKIDQEILRGWPDLIATLHFGLNIVIITSM